MEYMYRECRVSDTCRIHLDTAGRDTYTYTYVVCTVGAHTFESTTINVCSLQILTTSLLQPPQLFVCQSNMHHARSRTHVERRACGLLLLKGES